MKEIDINQLISAYYDNELTESERSFIRGNKEILTF